MWLIPTKQMLRWRDLSNTFNIISTNCTQNFPQLPSFCGVLNGLHLKCPSGMARWNINTADVVMMSFSNISHTLWRVRVKSTEPAELNHTYCYASSRQKSMFKVITSLLTKLTESIFNFWTVFNFTKCTL